MAAPEEPLVGTKRGGVGRFEDEMFGLVDEDLFFLGEFAPKEEDDVFFACRYLRDHGIGELGPADLGVAHGFVGADGERGVEQEDALLGPMGEVAVVGDGHTDVLVQFLKDVDEGGGRGDGFLDGKAKAVGLASAMVGVLSEQDDLDLIDGSGVEGVEDEAAGRIDRPVAHLFVFEQGSDLAEIGFTEFRSEEFFPAFFDLDVHSWVPDGLFWFGPKVNKTMVWRQRGFFLFLQAR